MISKSAILLLIVASSMVACNTTLIDAFVCTYDECEDEVNECYNTEVCLDLLKATIQYGLGEKHENVRYTKEQSDIFYDGQKGKNAVFDKLFTCMSEECSFRSLYSCSDKRYSYEDCLASNTASASSCYNDFGNKFVQDKSACQAKISDDCKKNKACEQEHNYKCHKDNIPSSSSNQNNISAYFNCEIAAHSAKAFFSLILVTLVLLF